jgi:hypothetical protein
MIVIISVILLFVGWGLFGMWMESRGGLIFSTFEPSLTMFYALVFMGACTGLGVLSIVNLL